MSVVDIGATPVSKPLVLPIVATVGSPLIQVPPPYSNNVTDWPGQIDEGADIATGNGLTVNKCVTGHAPASGLKVITEVP